MKILTCTPVAFGGGADFFARDSGLLCRGLQRIGIESRAVMPLPGMAEDQPDLIRIPMARLEDPGWWRAQQADGVVLYAWGRPKFREVASAIRRAGCFLILNQDNGGLVSPLAGFGDWLREQWILGGGGRGAAGCLRSARLTLRGLSVGLALTDPLRADHLSHGHVIACVSPKAAEHYRKLCRMYGRGLEQRVEVIPHAVESMFHAGESLKERRIVCVGRWSDELQKRTGRMTGVLESVLAEDPAVEVVIIGQPTDKLSEWHASLDKAVAGRIRLTGALDRESLADWMARSMVFYSPSAFESFGIAAAEALCCGCSVVAGESVSMASFAWFVSENSGRLSATDDVQGHARALRDELHEWDRGGRDPAAISAIWAQRLHAEKVAEKVASMVENHLRHRRYC